MKHLEEVITEKVNLSYIDEGLLKGFQETSLNLVGILSELRNNLLENSSQGSEGESLNINVKESFKDELVNIIGDIEMTSELVIPKLLSINDKIKTQEKAIIKEVLNLIGSGIKSKVESQDEILSPGLNRGNEEEVGELRIQLEELRGKLIEMEKVNEDLFGKYKKEEDAKTENPVNESETEDILKQNEIRLKEAEEKIRKLEEIREEDQSKKEEVENKIKENEKKLKETESKLKEFQMKAGRAEAQKDEIKVQLDWLKKEYQNLITTNEVRVV